MKHSELLFMEMVKTIELKIKLGDVLERHLLIQAIKNNRQPTFQKRDCNLKIIANWMNLRGIRTSRGGLITHAYLRKLVERVPQQIKDKYRPEFEEDNPSTLMGMASSFMGDTWKMELQHGY